MNGGNLDKIDLELEFQIKNGMLNIILDNTYMTVKARQNAIMIGKCYSYEVICIYLDTSMKNAQFNAVSRMIKRYGKLFKNNQDYKNYSDPNMFPPAVLFKARKIFEVPTLTEGFDKIIIEKFVRQKNNYTNKAVIFDIDNTIRKTKSGNIYPIDINDIEILPGRTEKRML